LQSPSFNGSCPVLSSPGGRSNATNPSAALHRPRRGRRPVSVVPEDPTPLAHELGLPRPARALLNREFCPPPSLSPLVRVSGKCTHSREWLPAVRSPGHLHRGFGRSQWSPPHGPRRHIESVSSDVAAQFFFLSSFLLNR
jgi:hypothetical protein